MKKSTGRPPSPGDKREKLVSFYLTNVDAEKLKRFADLGGFKGTSTLITALMEPIIHEGLSVQGAARAVNRVQKFMERNGAKFSITFKELIKTGRDLFGPPPPIPEDIEDISQLKADLRALLAELEKQETATQTHETK